MDTIFFIRLKPCVLLIFLSIFLGHIVMSHCVNIVNRTDWGAYPAKYINTIEVVPVPFVIIHHSYIPSACYTPDTCARAMRGMQNFHQNERGWADIGYTFGIGGDGQIYEGRGFDVVGAHAPRFNDKSIGICMIGDWTMELPPTVMIEAVQKFLNYAVNTGHLDRNYTLLGHRQVRNTECPGSRLFEEIKTWPHFSDTFDE